MANRVASPNLFAPGAPNWSLAQLDQNSQNAVGAINDSSLGAVNGPLPDTGSVNHYVVACTYGSPSAYNSGMTVFIKPTNTNTGASTLTVSPLSSLPIVGITGNPLVGGELGAGTTVGMVCDGISFHIFTALPPTASALVSTDPGNQTRLGSDNLIYTPGGLNGFVSKTAAYTLTTADRTKYIICSGGSWTLTLPAPAIGLTYAVRNDMGIASGSTTGTITLSPTGGTIDGQASIALLPQQDCTLISDGTNWRTHGLKREVVLGTQDITSSTAIASVLLPVGYRYFELEFTGLLSGTDAVNLVAQGSTDGGSTWLTAASYAYGFNFTNSTTTVAAVTSLSATSFFLATAVASSRPASNVKVIVHPGGTNAYPAASSWGSTWMTGAYVRSFTSSCHYFTSFVTFNALQYFVSSGNIAQSFLTVKGVV